MPKDKPNPLDHLPEDLARFDADPDVAYQMLQGQSGKVRAQRIDLIGHLALQEKQAGKGSWRERVQARLKLEDDATGLKVISDAAKTFDLFRMPPPYGLGFEQGQVAQYKPGRLRVFAQNADWSLKNADRVHELLEHQDQHNEASIREEIQKAKQSELQGKPVEKPDFENFVLRLKRDEASLLRTILGAVARKNEAVGGVTLSEKEGVRNGDLVMILASEWYKSSEEFDDMQGGIQTIPNSQWVAEAGDDAQELDEEPDDAAF